jgi:hypothetical protein
VIDTDPEIGPPAEVTRVTAGRWERTIRTVLSTGETVVTNVADTGMVRLDELELEFRMAAEDSVGIREGDPLSCWAEARRTSEQRRGAWWIRLEGQVRLTSTARHFHLTGSFEAFAGEQSVFRRRREATIPRDHV